MLALSLPSGTTWRIAGAGVPSSLGHHEPVIMEWGGIGSGVSQRDNKATVVEVSVTIADNDRTFARELGAHRGTLVGSPAVLRLVSPSVADADAAVLFVGILDGYTEEPPFVWTLRLRNDDRRLQRGELLKVPINTIDWPNAHTDAVGERWPIIYGTHDSQNGTAKGAVGTLYVDKVGFRYLVALGSVLVDRVYVSGTLTGAGFSVVYVTVNGKTATVIDFTADQGAAPVTADVRGLTDKPDGTGTVIQNPSSQLLHALTNFGFGDWRSGAYLDPSSAPLDVSSFHETSAFFDMLGFQGSRRFAGTDSPLVSAVLDESADSHEFKSFWTDEGRLAIRPLDYRPRESFYLDRPWIQGNEDGLSVKHEFDTKALLRRISLQFSRLEVEGRALYTVEVEDLSVVDDVTRTRALEWSTSTVLSPVGRPQNVGSRILRVFRRPTPVVIIRGPLPLHGVRLLDDVTLTHFSVPTTAAAGAGVERWARQRLRVLSKDLDPKSLEVELTCLDLKEYLANVWDTSISEEASRSYFNGSARLMPAASFVYTRSTKAWVENPATAAQGSKQIIELLANYNKAATGGQLIEGKRVNHLTRSCWISGTTGHSQTGMANGSAFNGDTADLLFDPAITPQSMRMTAGTPHTADLLDEWPGIGTQAARTYVCVSIYHKDDAGAALGWRLQRLVDNWYWNDSTEAWQSGVATNLLPVRTGTPERDASKPIAIGNDATSLKLFTLIPSGGTAARVNRVYHAQLEEGRFPTSPIVTDAATVTRDVDDHRYESFQGRRTWPVAHGHACIQVVPEFNASDVLTGDSRTFLEAWYGPDDYDRLCYEPAQSGLVFLRRVRGTEYRAVKAWTPVRGTAAKLGARWCGPDGELGLAPYTLSAFVDGVKGTDVVASGVSAAIPAQGYLRVLAGGFTRAGLKLWLRGDSLASTADGTAIATWPDSSGQGNDATQGTGAQQPILKHGVVNGLPILRFDGTDDRFNLPNFCSAFVEGEAFILVKIVADPPAAGTDGLWSFGTDALGDVYPFSGDSAIYDGFGSTARKSTGNPTPSLTAWRVYDAASRKGEWTSRFDDGAAHFTTATNVVGFRTDPKLGYAVQTGANFLKGDVAELLMFDRVLTPEERTGVVGYLSDKYALGVGGPGCVGNALYRHLDVRPFVPTDAEMADRP